MRLNAFRSPLPWYQSQRRWHRCPQPGNPGQSSNPRTLCSAHQRRTRQHRKPHLRSPRPVHWNRLPKKPFRLRSRPLRRHWLRRPGPLRRWRWPWRSCRRRLSSSHWHCCHSRQQQRRHWKWWRCNQASPRRRPRHWHCRQSRLRRCRCRWRRRPSWHASPWRWSSYYLRLPCRQWLSNTRRWPSNYYRSQSRIAGRQVPSHRSPPSSGRSRCWPGPLPWSRGRWRGRRCLSQWYPAPMPSFQSPSQRRCCLLLHHPCRWRWNWSQS
ncbi:hypothetical protein D9M69_272510 [compost metagenome]